MPHESILLISCYSSFPLYCSGKQIKSQHVALSSSPGRTAGRHCCLPWVGGHRGWGLWPGAGRKGWGPTEGLEQYLTLVPSPAASSCGWEWLRKGFVGQRQWVSPAPDPQTPLCRKGAASVSSHFAPRRVSAKGMTGGPQL